MSESISIQLVSNQSEINIDHGAFKNIVGQNQARKTLQFFIDSHDPLTPFPTLILTGGHGLGKSLFASIISKSLSREFEEINCGNVITVEQFMKIVFDKILDNRHPVTIFFDEAHELSEELTTLLLTLLNPRKDHINSISYKGLTLEWDMRSINVIFATTDAYRIFKPLRNRCQEIYFYPYSDEEIYQIVKNYLVGINITCNNSDLSMVCRSRARDAVVFAQNVQRYMSNESTKNFTQEKLNELKEMLGIYHLGLKRMEIELLQMVGEYAPISVANLATRLMVNQKNIEEEIEIRPRELGLIDSSTRGRVLTDNGKKYLKDLKTITH